MGTFLNMLKDYWGVLILLIGALAFLVTQGRARAGQIILSLMLQAEKNAEEYVLQTGDAKFNFVVQQGYSLLPKVIKAFITFDMFAQMANNLYAGAKQYLSTLKKNDKPEAGAEKEIRESNINNPN